MSVYSRGTLSFRKNQQEQGRLIHLPQTPNRDILTNFIITRRRIIRPRLIRQHLLRNLLHLQSVQNTTQRGLLLLRQLNANLILRLPLLLLRFAYRLRCTCVEHTEVFLGREVLRECVGRVYWLVRLCRVFTSVFEDYLCSSWMFLLYMLNLYSTYVPKG